MITIWSAPGIERMLADIADMTVIGQATTGEEAVSMSRELQPDVVLMDIRMPGIGGLEATRKIVSRDPHIKVIAVSAWTTIRCRRVYCRPVRRLCREGRTVRRSHQGDSQSDGGAALSQRQRGRANGIEALR